MYFIAHRGNTVGSKPELENEPSYIQAALDSGFDVEVDLWSVDGTLWLGHDRPEYETTFEFLADERLWCHAKNLQALREMLDHGDIHCFWHQNDDVALTSRGYIWTFPGKELMPGSICLMPELEAVVPDWAGCAGICSDRIRDYRNESSPLRETRA